MLDKTEEIRIAEEKLDHQRKSSRELERALASGTSKLHELHLKLEEALTENKNVKQATNAQV